MVATRDYVPARYEASRSPGCSILRSCKLEPDDGRSFGTFFFLTVILINSHGVASELICSDQPIVALAGDDVILPCQLQPADTVSSETILWIRPGLDWKYIHVHQDGRPMLMGQNPSYNNRTALFVDQLMNGNVSLKLFRVKLSDAGRYTCIIAEQMEASVQLTVGAASSPVVNVAGTDRIRGEVVLQCNSAGWYPEPEVFWLDGEGNLLSAGPTETVRGPDDLYTVSSRVTVEKRHSNSFTCRVQQNHINQIRETEIKLSAICFEFTSCSAHVAVLVVFVLLVILAAACVVWKWRQNQIKERKKQKEDQTEREQLITEKKRTEELEEKLQKKEKELKRREETLQEKEEMLKKTEDTWKKKDERLKRSEDFEQEVHNKLTEQSEELQKQGDKLKQQQEVMETNINNMEKEMNSVEKMAEGERFYKMKEITLTAKTQLNKRKQEDENLHIQTQTILKKTNEMLHMILDRKKEEPQEESQ